MRIVGSRFTTEMRTAFGIPIWYFATNGRSLSLRPRCVGWWGTAIVEKEPWCGQRRARTCGFGEGRSVCRLCSLEERWVDGVEWQDVNPDLSPVRSHEAVGSSLIGGVEHRRTVGSGHMRIAIGHEIEPWLEAVTVEGRMIQFLHPGIQDLEAIIPTRRGILEGAAALVLDGGSARLPRAVPPRSPRPRRAWRRWE